MSEIVEEAGDTLTHFAVQFLLPLCQSGRIVGLKDFHSRGAERFSSAQRCEVKGILYSVAIEK